MANWIQQVGKSSSPSLCPPFTLPHAFPSAALFHITLLLERLDHLRGDPFSRQLEAELSFFPIKFLSASCATEGDSKDKETASCVASPRETEHASGPPAEDLSAGRGFLTGERIQPGCGFAWAAGRAVFQHETGVSQAARLRHVPCGCCS